MSKNWYLYFVICLILGVTLGYGYVWSTPASGTPLAHPLLPARPVERSGLVIQPPKQSITLLFTGDVMLGRSVNKNIVTHNDPNWPFQNVAPQLSAADITYINLEGPLTPNCPVVESGFKFCGNLENALGLLHAGVDVASLANNHATNYGTDGLTSTVAELTRLGISPVGLGTPVRVERRGQIFTFLSLNDIGPYPIIDNVNLDTLSDKVSRAKVEGEVLIVTFHWGHEYHATPSDRQIKLAHQTIEAGADLVIGAHPHWVQTNEVYQGKPIYYSLGNFVFDQEWSTQTKQGLAVQFTYDGDQLVDTLELPVLIENYGQPKWQ